MISIEKQQEIYDLLPSTIDMNGNVLQIKKVTQSYTLPDYVSPVLAIQFVDEFGMSYQSIERGYTEIDEDSFSLSADYRTLMLITVAADDTEPMQRSVTFTYEGSAVPQEPYKTIISVTPSTPVLGQPVTIVYTRIIRGYHIVREIMRKVYDLAEYEFPVAVTSASGTRDLSELVGRESLPIIQGTLALSSEYTSIHSAPDLNTPVEQINIEVL